MKVLSCGDAAAVAALLCCSEGKENGAEKLQKIHR